MVAHHLNVCFNKPPCKHYALKPQIWDLACLKIPKEGRNNQNSKDIKNKNPTKKN